jgi:hypothetical protein
LRRSNKELVADNKRSHDKAAMIATGSSAFGFHRQGISYFHTFNQDLYEACALCDPSSRDNIAPANRHAALKPQLFDHGETNASIAGLTLSITAPCREISEHVANEPLNPVQ